jgi:hypothetical protein
VTVKKHPREGELLEGFPVAHEIRLVWQGLFGKSYVEKAHVEGLMSRNQASKRDERED